MKKAYKEEGREKSKKERGKRRERLLEESQKKKSRGDGILFFEEARKWDASNRDGKRRK